LTASAILLEVPLRFLPRRARPVSGSGPGLRKQRIAAIIELRQCKGRDALLRCAPMLNPTPRMAFSVDMQVGFSVNPGTAMRALRYSLGWLLVAAVAVVTAGRATAQQSTTATYQDWVLQCQSEAGSPPRKTCDIAQVTQVQGKNLPFSRVAVARPVRGMPVMLTVQLPVNVSVRTDVRIQTSNADAGLIAPFDHCIPGGCFANFALTEDMLKKFHGANDIGKLTFKNAGGQDVSIPLSFKGFAAAFDALVKE
jgi:invasion protein IalB